MATQTQQAARESIGQRLRRLRLERGLSQRELSEKGVSYAYISRIEAGSRQPSVKALRLLARKLGVSADYLETGSEVRAVDQRELRLTDAELALRLEGDPAAVEPSLREVLEEALGAGDAHSAARARVALGLVAVEQGRPAEAVELLEAGLADMDLLPASRPDLYAALARVYAAVGRPERAVELLEHCLRTVAETTPEDGVARVRFATYLSEVLAEMGEARRARAALDDVDGAAEEYIDPYARIRLYWSVGRELRMRGRLSLALDYVRRATALLEATGDTRDLARAHLTYARALLVGGQHDESAAHLARAEGLLGPRPVPADLAWLRAEQARLAVAQGSAEEAVRRAGESLALLADGDPAAEGAAQLALAEGHALGSDVDAAVAAFAAATDKLERAGSRHAAAQACRSWARLLRRAGREVEALDVLERATDLAVSSRPADTRSG